MSVNRLDSSTTFVVGSNGVGTSLPMGPAKYGDQWHVTLISMQSSGNALPTAQLFVYRGSPLPINQIDYTKKVTGDTSNTDVTLQIGEYLNFQMTGATPGTVVTIHVTGDLYGLR